MISTLHVARLKAWGAHGFTATGVVTAFLATLALLDNQPTHCLMWLGVALIVDGLDRSIDMRVSALRKKLNDEHAPYRLIKTIRGFGYLFVMPGSNG